jgi:hypothetical protein
MLSEPQAENDTAGMGVVFMSVLVLAFLCNLRAVFSDLLEFLSMQGPQ